MLLTLYLILYFVFYAILDRSKIELNSSTTRVLLVTFYISATLALISIYLSTLEVYFVSDFLNKTVIWYPIILAGIILSVGVKTKNILHKFSLYAFMTFGLIILMVTIIPFVGININTYFTSSPGTVYYNDDLILVQDSYNGILSKPYAPDIYKKKYKIFAVQQTSLMNCPVSKNIKVKVQNRRDYYEVNYLNPDGSENCSTRLIKK